VRKLPEALSAFADYKQFILYQVEPSKTRPGKTDKFPIDWKSGKHSNAHDQSIWIDHIFACDLVTVFGKSYGVGFVFTEDDPFWFLDLDNCLTSEGWNSEAQRLLKLLPGCAVEVSHSGNGLHFFGKGNPPPHSCRNQALGLEFYHVKRFVALTGKETAGSAATDCTAALATLIPVYFPVGVAAAACDTDGTAAPVEDWLGSADDSELLARAMRSKSAAAAFACGVSFEDLWAANAAVLGRFYPDPGREYDHSRADMALAQHLAFWTGKNCERIERLMYQSALRREKWDRPDIYGTYLRRTILAACSRQADVYRSKAIKSPARTVPAETSTQLSVDDFLSVLPEHRYINRRTLELHSADAVNGNLLHEAKRLGMRPNVWLDSHRYVTQKSWLPGQPEIIEGTISQNGYLRPDPRSRIYNTYRASDAVETEDDPRPWLDHLRLLFPGEVEHLIRWFAHKIQNPGGKINHALFIGGGQGIGKDLMLIPLRYGVGRCNCADINPGDLFAAFQPWVESTLVIINEARDLGAIDRVQFQEHLKRFIAAPPDTLPCNRKYLNQYNVPNVMGIVITSNNKLSSIYLDRDDRRYFVAWSSSERQPTQYFDRLARWMKNGGMSAVVGYLQRFDLEGFDPMAPPPKTEAWHEIVASQVNPEEAALSESLENAPGGRPKIVTIREVTAMVRSGSQIDLTSAFADKRKARGVRHLMEKIGYEFLRNPHSKDGRWRMRGTQKETIYADRELSYAERLRLANERCEI
jgi:hypothetical protein